jgi:hypothetical protein
MTPVKKERRDQREVRQKQSTSFWDIIETEAPYFLYARHEPYGIATTDVAAMLGIGTPAQICAAKQAGGHLKTPTDLSVRATEAPHAQRLTRIVVQVSFVRGRDHKTVSGVG